MTAKLSSKAKGIICITASAMFFAFMNMFVRLSGDLPSIQKSFFRNFVAMVFALIILLKERPRINLDKESGGYLIVRSVAGTIGILCNFYAVDHLVLADASMLNKMSPFFAIIFSIIILKEKINIRQLSIVIMAFLGALLVIKPSGNMDSFPALMGLLSGIGAGLAYTCVRALGQRKVKGPFIVFFFSAFSCLSTLPYLLFKYSPMSTVQLAILLLAGLSAAGGQFCITAAYTYAPAREISVYDYSIIIFSAILGYFIFGQTSDAYSVIGYVVIIGAAVANSCLRPDKAERITENDK